MANFFARYWKTLAITSVTLTSSYFFSHPRINNRLPSLLTVRAAEYERRNAGTASSRNRSFDQRKENIDEEDDDDDEDGFDRTDDSITNIRERRFRQYASIEYNNEIFMTPADFLESIVTERPRPRIGRRQITEEMVDSILYNTPPKYRGSKRFFRNLEDAGLISFLEYLFLWVILTKPHTQFDIAFAMFDTDGDRLIDKHEFLVIGRVMSDKRMLHPQIRQKSSPKSHTHKSPDNYFSLASLSKRLFSKPKHKPKIKGFAMLHEAQHTKSTLILHFFGKNGRDRLNLKEFRRFMKNFQLEVLEIEFTEFSHGFKTISDLDFAEILLRYTDISRDMKKFILKKVAQTTDEPSTITFEQFQSFFQFLNNLEEFSIAMRFHQLSNKPISQAEFQRAAKISTGYELESHLISLMFRIFDVNNDHHLSYDEFMGVMKDRLSRSYQTADHTNVSSSKFDQFKRCFRERARV